MGITVTTSQVVVRIRILYKYDICKAVRMCLVLIRHIVNYSYYFFFEKSHTHFRFVTILQKILWLFLYFHLWVLELKRVARVGLVPFVTLLVESREWGHHRISK